MRWRFAAPMVLGMALIGPLTLAGQQRVSSSAVGHEITHVVQQGSATRSTTLTLDSGARLTLPPGAATIGSTLTFRRVARETLPSTRAGLRQIGDTLVLDGAIRGSRGSVVVSMPASPGRRPAGGRLVLVGEIQGSTASASVGGNQTETVGAVQQASVSGGTASAADGRYYVTSARHRRAEGRIEATISADATFRSLHFGWL